ncbi:inositol monophosphatase family protein [Candidatus Saccharibacteria bacterium]|nr:inositol monophosphatase family protein [Candidatus Saccharibacteria bacterium]
MLEKLLLFVREAGEFALENQKEVSFKTSRLKSANNQDVVTETDMEISRRFQNFMADNFADLDYIIVDEESIADLGADPMTEIKRHEWAFIIDPIDGTLTYSNQLPYWGISIGVFRKEEPILGVLFAPALKLLVYADERDAFIEENGTPRKLKKLTDAASLYINHCFNGKDLDQRDRMNIVPFDCYSVVVNAIYVITGQARGMAARDFLWDIAGACSIFARVGVETYNSKTGQPFNLFDSEMFTKELRIRDPNISCLPKYHADFRKIFKLD